MTHDAPADAESDADAERHATNLELFLDLVFVFAVTQITGMLSHDLSWAGVGKAALLAWLVWWQWSQFTWAGAAVDLQRRSSTRLLVLGTIPATLVMATALPVAYAGKALWFGASYLAVQLLVLAMQGSDAIKAEATRRAFARYASVAVISPVVVLGGALLEGDARIVAWIAAALITVAGALRGASAGAWVINPVHFAERHALFVIIALGEVLVAVGTTASGLGLTSRVLVALGVAAGGACVIWWTYFAFIPHVAEHTLRASTAARRGVVARDLFTFGHFPIIAGIIGYAAVVKHMLVHPFDPAAPSDRALLLASAALLIAGYLHIQYRVTSRLAPERLTAIVALAAWCGLATEVPSAAVVGVTVVVLAAMQAITWRRFRGGALAEVTSNR